MDVGQQDQGEASLQHCEGLQAAGDSWAEDAGGSTTSVDEAEVLALIRTLVPVPTAPSADGTSPPDMSTDAAAKEAAGALLWDLSVIEGVASVMMHAGMILPVLEAVITAQLLACETCDQQQEQQAAAGVAAEAAASTVKDPARPIEVALGILANLASRSMFAEPLSQQAALLDLITGPVLHCISSTPALSELCRLGSTALRKKGTAAWLARLSDPDACVRMVWIASQSPDPILHARCLDLIVALIAPPLDAAHVDDGVQQQREGQQQQQPPAEVHEQQQGETQHNSRAAEAEQHVPSGSQGVGPGGTVGTDEAQQAQEASHVCARLLMAAGLLPLLERAIAQACQELGSKTVTGTTWAELTPAPGLVQRTPALHLRGGWLSHTPHDLNTPLRGGIAACPAAAGAAGTDKVVPLTEASVDAALRCVEALGALPENSAERQALLGDMGLVQDVVQLLHTNPSEQVLESLLLALQALAEPAVQVLGLNTSHMLALLDCLGELPSSDKGAWQREMVVYLVARACQAAAKHHSRGSEHEALQQPGSYGAQSGSGRSAGSPVTATAPAPASPGGAHTARSPARVSAAGSRAAMVRSPTGTGSRLAVASKPPIAGAAATAGDAASSNLTAAAAAERATVSRGTKRPRSEAGDGSPGQSHDDGGVAAGFGPDVDANTRVVMDVGELLDIATRIAGLRDSCGVSGDHVEGYIRAAAKSMLVVMAAHDGLVGDATTTLGSRRAVKVCKALEALLRK